MLGDKKPRILIVDDLLDMRMVLRITLERAGWEVVEAQSSLQAIELATQHKPDVILMDFNMPQMNGIQACQQIKQSPEIAHIPVVMYTGAYAPAIKESAMAAGVHDFLTKPLLPGELRERLQKIVEARR